MSGTSQPFACHLRNRGLLRIGGADRCNFLQGLISNDVNAVARGRPVYAALLTPQGKFLHDMFVVEDGESFLIDCEAARRDDLMQRLTAHKLRAKITIDAVDDREIWAAWNGTIQNDGWFADPRLPALGTRTILKTGSYPSNLRAANFNDYDRHRLTLGVPDGSRDMIVGKSTLAECNLDRLNGISWTKGCYMGQELTARIHHRGLVKKRLHPVKISGTAPECGAVVRDGTEDIGDMRSSCGDIGLALLDIGKAEKAHKENRAFSCCNAMLSVLASALPAA